MDYINNITCLNTDEPSVIALGNFDGVHLGHRYLIDTVKRIAMEKGFKSIVFTFNPHPSEVIKGIMPVVNIYDRIEKNRLMSNMGIDKYIEFPFTTEVARLKAEDFVKDILVDMLNVKVVVVGYNYRFGYKKHGDTYLLKELGEKYGFTVKVINPQYFEDYIVSSTLIRKLIMQGDMELVANMLGQPYSIYAQVKEGKKLGREIGYPTINMYLDNNKITPKNGVYVTETIYDNKRYKSITNVGHNPTVTTDNSIKVETHIFDFEKDLYGSMVEVEFLYRIRDEKKFDSLDNLIRQITEDAKLAKSYKSLQNDKEG